MHPVNCSQGHTQTSMGSFTLPPGMRGVDGQLQLHPAFLPGSYSLHPGGLLLRPSLPGITAMAGTHAAGGEKGKAFTIEAILGKDRGPGGPSPGVLQSHGEGQRLPRRGERLHESSHPYMSALGCAGWRYAHHATLNTNRGDKKCGGSLSSGGCTSDWKQGKAKRVRTIFTPEQLERLEAEFERQQYMVGTERYYLAASLNLTEAQVKVWFQNRRIKWRKLNLEKQHAKLAKMEMFGTGEEEEASESEAEVEISDDMIIQDGDDSSLSVIKDTTDDLEVKKSLYDLPECETKHQQLTDSSILSHSSHHTENNLTETDCNTLSSHF